MGPRGGVVPLPASRCCAVLFLLLLQGAPSCPSQPLPACSVSCLCRQDPRVDCSSAGLSSSTSLDLPATVASLDLSHNDLTAMPPRGHDPTPLQGLTSLLLAHNRIASLSLCVAPPPPGSLRPCSSWAPRLRLLSLEWNRLHTVPEGLGGGAFLQVLHLSHNHIDALRHRDLRGCKQLKELYLQHNAISSIHPLAFQDLHALQVLNLSFNALSTTATTAYLSIRNLDAQADVRGNRWRCNCDLRTVKRWMGFDRDREHLPWQLLCEEPPHLAGRDLLHLDDAELTCAVTHRSTTSYQEVYTASGADVLLSCQVQQQGPLHVYWWTPFGVTPSSNVHGSLLIRSIQVHDEGLYACSSWTSELPASVFDVHVQEDVASARRKARDVHTGRREAGKTHSEFVLAVCLSVFITFACAFILGAAARPLLNTLWRRMCTKRNSGRVPKACENEGFSAEEEGAQQGRTRGTYNGTSRSHHPTNEPHYVTIYTDYTNQCDAGSIEVIEDDAGQTYENVSVQRSETAKSFSKDEDLPSYSEDTGSLGVAQHSQKGGDDQSDRSVRNIPETLLTSNVCNMDINFTPEAVNQTEAEGISGGVQHYRHHDTTDLGSSKPDSLLHSAFKRELEADWAEKAAKLEDAQVTAEIWEVSPSQHVDLSAASAITHTQIPLTLRREGHEQAGFSPGHLTDLQDPNFDPDLWNDSGDSFEFSDSFQEASFRTSPQDPSEANSTTQPDTDPWARSPFEPKEKNDLREEDEGFNKMSCYKDLFIQHSHRFRMNSVVQPQKSYSLREFYDFSSNLSVNEDEQTRCPTRTKPKLEQTDFTRGSELTDESEGNSTADPWGLTPAEPQERDDLREEQDDGFNYKLTFKDPFIQDSHRFKTDSAVEPQQESQTSDSFIECHESSSNSSIFEDEPPDCILRSELRNEPTGYTVGSKFTEESRGYSLNSDLRDKPLDLTLSSYLREEPVKFTSETVGQKFNFEKPFYIHSYCLSSSTRAAWAASDDVPVQSGSHLAEEMGEASKWGLADSTSGRETAAGDHPERSASYSSEEPEPLAWSDLALPFKFSTNSEDEQWRPEETDQQTPRRSPIPVTLSNTSLRYVNSGPPIKPRRSFVLAQQPVVTDKTQEDALVMSPSSPSLEEVVWFSRMFPQLSPKQDSRMEGLLFQSSRMIEVFDPLAHSSLARGVDKGLSESESVSRTSPHHLSSWRSGSSLHEEALDNSIPTKTTTDLAKETAVECLSRDETGTDDPYSVQGLSQHHVDTSRNDEGPDNSHLTFLSSGTNLVEGGRNESSEA